MPRKKINKLRKLANAKNQYIIDQLESFSAIINNASAILTQQIIDEFLEQLDTEDAELINEASNIRKVNLLENIFKKFQQTQGVRIITAFVQDLSEITKLGSDYYTELIPNQLASADIEKIINEKLGLVWEGGDWTPKSNGYINSLISDNTIRNDIKKIAYNNIIGRNGYGSLKEAIKNYLNGIGQKPGAYYKFYENYAFDTYSEVDRLNSKMHADRLGLQYFVYNGGIINDSREFCKQRSGKVFHVDETDEWKDLIGKFKLVSGKRKDFIKVPIGPIVEDADTYNPIVDLGGIKCRHSADFISDEIAKELRKDLSVESSDAKQSNPVDEKLLESDGKFKYLSGSRFYRVKGRS